jgi:serine O-acetyltransferase
VRSLAPTPEVSMPPARPGRRVHPKNPWVSNSLAARVMIGLTRHRVPLLSRLYMYFLGCDIGLALPESVFLPHPMGIVIHNGAKIGENVVIGHQVTIGGRDLTSAAPIIEDGVYIGAGAKILGGLRIGRGATIGANAVVTKDIPAGVTAVGANKVVSLRGPYAMD